MWKISEMVWAPNKRHRNFLRTYINLSFLYSETMAWCIYTYNTIKVLSENTFSFFNPLLFTLLPSCAKSSEKLINSWRHHFNFSVLFSFTEGPGLGPGINCTQPAIDDFPRDPFQFTDADRQQGYVVCHIVASLYLFIALAIVCDKYFVPAVERICHGKLKRHLSNARIFSYDRDLYDVSWVPGGPKSITFVPCSSRLTRLRCLTTRLPGKTSYGSLSYDKICCACNKR